MEAFLRQEIQNSVYNSTTQSVADYLRTQLPALIHSYNFQATDSLQIQGWEQTCELSPNAIFSIQRNLFILEVCANQEFKFVFLEAELMPLLAVALRRCGVIPPFTQISSARIPLIEILTRVTILLFLYFF